MTSADGSAAPAVHATIHALTHPGCVRADNQDCYLVADLSVSPSRGPWRVGTDTGGDCGAERFVVGPCGLLAIVADGMGGAAAGAVASRLAVAEVYGAMTQPWESGPGPGPFARRLREAVEGANVAIHRHASREPGCAGMGTTLTAAAILGQRVLLAQVGDSRAYLVRDGGATQLTRDQSLAQSLSDAGTLTPDQAEQRGLSSILLQALGPEPRVAADMCWQRLRPEDVLVLCSDGLSRTVARVEIAAAAHSEPDPAALSRTLLDTAIRRGAPDNVTVLVVRMEGTRPEHPKGTAPFGPGGNTDA